MDNRLTRLETGLRTLGLVVAGGVVLSITAYLITSIAPITEVLGGPGIRIVEPAGFDPWTGQAHGLSYTYDPVVGLRSTVTNTIVELPVPEEMSGRQAIPLPVGFAVGCVVTIGALMFGRAGRRPANGIAGPPPAVS